MKRLTALILIVFTLQMCKIVKPYNGTFLLKQEDNLWTIKKELHGKELLIMEDFINIENGRSFFSGLVCSEIGCTIMDSNSADGVAFTPGIANIEIYQAIKIDKNILQGKFLSRTDCNGHFAIEIEGTDIVGLIFSYSMIGDGSRYYEFNPNNKIDDRNRLKVNFIDC